MVDNNKILHETGAPLRELEAVVTKGYNPKRQPQPPAPEGGISLSQAKRKYGVHFSTTSRWVNKGYIPVLLRTKWELYIDESRLAEVVALYKTSPGRGKKTVRQNINAARAEY